MVRRWYAVDACGNNSTTRTQTITVQDTHAPSSRNAGATLSPYTTLSRSFTAPTASDACSSYTVVQVTPDVTTAGSCPNNYSIARRWYAVDACGNNSATRTQTITVQDTQAPTIGNAGANCTIECTATPSFT